MVEDPAAKPVLNEIATTGNGRDITHGIFQGLILPTKDPLLAGKGGGLEIYEDVLRDWQVASTFQQRRLAVVSAEWKVDAGAEDSQSQKAAEFLKSQLDAIEFDDATNKMLYGLFYGYSAAELLWARDGNQIIIDKIKVRKARRFRFDLDGNLRLLTAAAPRDGELLPPRKFWTFSTGVDNDDDPYGLGLGHWCFWPVFFKRNGLKAWALFLEKYASPTSVGKYPANTPAKDQAKLLEATASIHTDSAVILPEGMAIELIEAKRSAGGNHDIFYERMEAAIAKVILSQTMTTDSGSSLSQSEVHMEVREEVTASDADLICASFNEGPVRWLTDWNFPGATPPSVWRITEPPDDLDKRATRDKLIFDMGYNPTPEYIQQTYGDGWEPKIAGPDKPPVVLADFAEARPPRDAADDLSDQVEDAGDAAFDKIVNEMRALIERSNSLEEASQALLKSHPDIGVADLAAVLRDGLALAELTGRSDLAGDV